MKQGIVGRIAAALACTCAALSGLAFGESFTAFETPHVRPLALASDGALLYAVNTPDNRLTIYRATDGGLTLAGEVPVGLEPVSVALRETGGRTEAWVVNHLSDSVSVVEINTAKPSQSRIIRTLLVGDEPRDLVFAGADRSRAFITTAHRGQSRPDAPELTTQGVGRADVWVFDANNPGAALGGTPLTILELFGDTPRALAVSPDGSTVYAAVFASGSRTTAIPAPVVSSFGGLPPAPEGATPGAPATGLIVKNVDGQWVDETGKDWSALVPFSLPDYDVFKIDATANPPVETAKIAGVGTMLFNMAVRPDTGAVYVTNTEALNEVRFEPMMTGKFAQNRVTVIKDGIVTLVHLNPHIDYSVPTGTLVEIDQSLASPADLVFSADGSKVFVAGFSSAAVGVFGTDALEAGQVDKQMIRVGQGPSGLALDAARDRLYVMNRLDGSVSVIAAATNAAQRTELARVDLPYDPTPQVVKDGRQFLYDARISSGHGDLSCHTCHVFADTDHIAWDLGNPFGHVTENPNEKANVTGPGNQTLNEEFHPMKGPMTTQSLRGMADAGPMHWRGDKTGGLTLDGVIDPEGDFLDEHAAFLRFNGAFTGLQGRAEELSAAQIDAYADFILNVRYPPNPIKSLDDVDNALQAKGREIFHEDETSFAGAFPCSHCHTLPVTTTGLAASAGFEPTRFFKIPHLRNLYQKVGKFGVPAGMTISTTSLITLATPNYVGDQVRGFGFTHDGSIDTIDTFLHNFTFLPFPTAGNVIPDATAPAISPGRRAALEAFMLSIDTGLKPVVGQQATLTPSNAADAATLSRVDLLLARADAGDANVVVKGLWNGAARGAVYQGGGSFKTDKASESALSKAQLLELAAVAGHALTFTAVPPGNGTRIGIDRDEDGTLDADEVSTDPVPVDAPVAALSATPAGGEIPLQVSFDASGSQSADGSALVSYTFLFGDGGEAVTTASPTLSYTYTAAGTFEAQVVVTDAYGNSSASPKLPITATVNIDVGNSDHAVAAMTVTPTSGSAPLTVSFDGSRSFGADSHPITAYTWDFGDGTPVQTTATATTQHVYTSPGSYTPTLSVTDSQGNVSPQKATAQVKADPASGGSTGGSTGGSAKSGGGAVAPMTLLLLSTLLASRRRRRPGCRR